MEMLTHLFIAGSCAAVVLACFGYVAYVCTETYRFWREGIPMFDNFVYTLAVIALAVFLYGGYVLTVGWPVWLN